MNIYGFDGQMLQEIYTQLYYYFFFLFLPIHLWYSQNGDICMEDTTGLDSTELCTLGVQEFKLVDNHKCMIWKFIIYGCSNHRKILSQTSDDQN